MKERVHALVPLLLATALAIGLIVVAGCSGQTGQNQGEQQEEEQATTRIELVEQWLESSHARVVTFAAEEEGCKNCHDGQTFSVTGGGFQGRLGTEATGTTEGTGTTGSAEATPPRDWVVATDCRVCHTGAGVEIADAGNVEQIPNIERANGGVGAVCMACHNGWHPAGAQDGELSAPHGSVQTDMLYGANTMPVQAEGGATQSEVESESPHLDVPDTCAGCHVTGAGGSPNHTFRVTDYDGCQREDCHDEDMTEGGTAKEDYDGDGNTEKLQVEVDGLLESLEAAITQSVDATSVSTARGSVVFGGAEVGPNDPAYAAAYNYFYVQDDRSRGVHSAQFTVRLLQDSIASLGGTQGTGETTGSAPTTP